MNIINTKHYRLAFYFVFSFILCLTTSCDKDDEYSQSDIIGTWTVVKDEGVYEDKEYGEREEWEDIYEEGVLIFEFSKNSVLTVRGQWVGEDYYVDEHEYSVKGNKLITYYEEDDYTATHKIAKLTSEELILESQFNTDYSVYQKTTLRRLE